MKPIELHIGFYDYTPISIDAEQIIAYHEFGSGVNKRTLVTISTGAKYEVYEDYDTVTRLVNKALSIKE